MWQSEVSVEIDAPVAEVYSYLADFPRHPEWSSAALTDLRMLTPGPISVGSEFETVDHVPSKQVTRSRVTALEPNRRIGWHSLGLRGLLPVDWEFLLFDRDGRTQLVQRSAWDGSVWPLLRLLGRRRQIPVENRHSLERIKAALENKVPVSGSRTS
jgi:uncharacterized protein YndB with AHSA1/START domain